jgi:hypothetical protein
MCIVIKNRSGKCYAMWMARCEVVHSFSSQCLSVVRS